MEINEDNDTARRFLSALFQLSKGNPGFTISMYKVGETLGLDKAETSRTAEWLIGNNLLEIKTLSGGIGITQTAADTLNQEAQSEGEEKITSLTDALILDGRSRRAIDTVVTAIKHQINELGLNFDQIKGLVADIATIDAQLTSPTPKTAILRECFISLKSWTDKTPHKEIKDRIRSILG